MRRERSRPVNERREGAGKGKNQERPASHCRKGEKRQTTGLLKLTRRRGENGKRKK